MRSRSANTAPGRPWRLDLIGVPRLCGPDDAHVVYLDRKAAALLACLAIAGPVSRSRAAGLLWPDNSESSARNNLRQLLHRLRATAPVVRGDDPLSLAPDLDVDVTRLLKGSTNSPTIGAVAELLTGMDYADCEELNEWLLAERERVRRAQRAALESEADRWEREGDFNAALAAAHLLLEMEPVSEAAHRRVMRLHYLNNDRSAALRAYHRCQAVLRQTLSIDPLPETAALAQQIERGTVLPGPTAWRAPIPPALLRPPVLAGREREWAAMEAAWSAGQLIFLTGEAGVGKTRLAFEFAGAKGRFLRHEGRQGDAAIPYAHLDRAIRQTLDSEQRIDLEPWARRELARIVPELYPYPPPPISSHEEKIRFFEAIDRLLRLSAQRTAVVVDDLHALHPASLEVLDHLVSKVTPTEPLPGGVRWLLTFRPAEMHAESTRRVETFVAAGIGVLIDVPPLDGAGVRDMLKGLEIEGLDRMSDRIAALTGGNPLFIVETLKTAFESGVPHTAIPQRVVLPQRVGAVIRQRLDRLSDDALQLARTMAVAGPEFTAALAVEALGFDEARVADATAELEAAQITREGRFTHDLLMETVQGSTPARIRAALHRSVATCLEASSGDPARIAHHWAAAGHPSRALPWLVQAADVAVTRGAHSQAAEWLERVASQADPRSHLRIEAMVRLGRLLASSDAQRARAILQQCLQTAQQRDDPALTVRAMAAMAEAAGLAGNQTEAVSLVEQATARAPADLRPEDRDSLLVGRFRVYSRSGDLAATEQALAEAMQQSARASWQPFALALLRWHQGAFRDGAEVLERLLRDRPEVGQVEMVHNNLGMCYWALGEPEVAKRWIGESVRIWQGSGNLFSEALSRSNLGLVCISLGRYADALAHLEAARETALRLGSYTLVADTLNRLGTLNRQSGRLREAVALQQEALDLMRAVGDKWRLSYIVASAAAALAEMGDLRAAWPLAEEAFDLTCRVGYTFGIPIGHRCVAEVALRAGDRKRALRHAADAVDASRRHGMAEQLGYSLVLQAECEARSGGPTARRLLEEGLEIGRTRHIPDLTWRAATRLTGSADRQAARHAKTAWDLLRTHAPPGWLRRPGPGRRVTSRSR